jgi:hypothetical protein
MPRAARACAPRLSKEPESRDFGSFAWRVIVCACHFDAADARSISVFRGQKKEQARGFRRAPKKRSRHKQERRGDESRALGSTSDPTNGITCLECPRGGKFNRFEIFL